MYPKRARVIRKCASRRGLASPRVTGCNAPQVSDEYTMLVFSFLSEVSRAIVSPAIYWMQQNEGRNLLEMPAFLREHFARLAELAADARILESATADQCHCHDTSLESGSRGNCILKTTRKGNGGPPWYVWL